MTLNDLEPTFPEYTAQYSWTRGFTVRPKVGNAKASGKHNNDSEIALAY